MREHIDGDFLFIDTDTIICGSLNDIALKECEIAMTPDCHLSIRYNWMRSHIKKWSARIGWQYSEDMNYFNSGVMYVKDTNRTHQLFKHWHAIWKEFASQGINYDQPSLAKANEDMGYLISELDGSWNCQVNANGLPFLMDAKIIHYFASGIGIRKETPYRFLDKNLFLYIKSKGMLDDTVKALISNAKSAFNPFCTVIGYDDAKFLYTNVYWLYVGHPNLYRVIDFLSKLFLFAMRFIPSHKSKS